MDEGQGRILVIYGGRRREIIIGSGFEVVSAIASQQQGEEVAGSIPWSDSQAWCLSMRGLQVLLVAMK